MSNLNTGYGYSERYAMTHNHEAPKPRSDLKRLSVIIDLETDAALVNFAHRKGISKAESLRRLVLMGAMMDEADQNGEEIIFKNEETVTHVRPL